mmetsp:Transcript_2083/g.4293  ORF Transcript_2083/g.4293 Transcript_2083/m.4293 type:complete len:831 (-) Transcript_2083:71-2563(-)
MTNSSPSRRRSLATCLLALSSALAANNNSNNSNNTQYNKSHAAHGAHRHEPLPAMMFINKMDRDGADFRHAIDTVKRKLKGSHPVAVQLPLYRMENANSQGNDATTNDSSNSNSRNCLDPDIVAGTLSEPPPHGEFVGVLDIVHMRALVYPPNAEGLTMEEAVPTVVDLRKMANVTSENANASQVLNAALEARRELIAALANVDEDMEDLYLEAMMMEEEENEGSSHDNTTANGTIYQSCPILNTVSTSQIQSSLRRTTLSRSIMPTFCGAALRGLGVEPLLDAVAGYLPCPLDRLPPSLKLLGNSAAASSSSKSKKNPKSGSMSSEHESEITLGHPLHPSTLAYVFKVLHMKGRGGSGDGRVAFARVYSGTLKARDSVRVISPSSFDGMTSLGGSDDDDTHGKKSISNTKHPVERIGGMLELSGGKFDNLQDGVCLSGDVCALVGLKGVVTGDTLLLTSAGVSSGGGDKSGYKSTNKSKSNNNNKTSDVNWKQYMDGVHLAGLTSPKPVLTIRVEANSSSEQSRLSAALSLLSVEDPSLVVEETPTTTLISGLGELHMEIVLDRLRREFGLEVRTGKPAVAYRETVDLKDGEGTVETDGFVEYDRAVGGVRLQGAVRLRLSSRISSNGVGCVPPEEPVVTLSRETRAYFGLDPKGSSEDESEHKYPPSLKALLSGVRGSLKRGRVGPYPLANLECRILDVDSELSNSPETLPGAMRAAAANAVTTLLETLAKDGRLVVLEPKMNVEISVPREKVGFVLSDLTARRGVVDDVAMGDDGAGGSGGSDHIKAMVKAEVPLVEILGYANSLRSLTGGEGAFSAEYKGHAPKEG